MDIITLAASLKLMKENMKYKTENITSEYFSKLTISKSGNVKQLQLGTSGNDTSMDTSTTDYVKYFTLPDEYKPQTEITQRFHGRASNTMNDWIIKITTDGDVYLGNYNKVAHPGISQTIVFM